MSSSTLQPNKNSCSWCRDFNGNHYDFDTSLGLIRDFHGHAAPGLIIGVKMVSEAISRMPGDILYDAVCETSSCLPDAVQILTPCTTGNGWMKIRDLGRYAVTLYDKAAGEGVRVSIDPEKLAAWPEFYCWFYKEKPKKQQDFKRLVEEIFQAGSSVLKFDKVHVPWDVREKRSKGAIATCPSCKEAYPAAHGSLCRGCMGMAPTVYGEKVRKTFPDLVTVPVEKAEGMSVLHDMTRIVPGREKGPVFKKSDVISGGDICRLQQMGRVNVYANAPSPDEWVHEDDAALGFARAMAGEGIGFAGEPREGKINLHGELDGMVLIDTERLMAFNHIPGVICSSIKNYRIIKKGDMVAGTRAIPLYLNLDDYRKAMCVLAESKLFSVKPLKKSKIGVLVTGTEVFRGLVEDGFAPLIRRKAEAYGCSVVSSMVVPDDRQAISEGVRAMGDAGVDILVTTAGLSVDPDDVTRQGLEDAGCRNIVYGAPVLPGAMTLVAGHDHMKVIGVPACGLYHEVTAFDLLFPRLLAGVAIDRNHMASMAHGGFCRSCKVCEFPDCSFGV